MEESWTFDSTFESSLVSVAADFTTGTRFFFGERETFDLDFIEAIHTHTHTHIHTSIRRKNSLA
jgi:hypothetical protein